ncbi:PucR family transcriptional regulator [Pseudonocardia asaccharolytica DSM 44247 = NBRC 16224]|uniref:PucR family transcriptional regulator n=2 Tax=Pseudonocardia asaccharolytica TaxID=54010 RepID=A0A511CXU1_9PSEU|nr:PucR family transcriptional regulator [Pseudonocardia asaccharolytica DSM 44247 = NBRC 16224]
MPTPWEAPVITVEALVEAVGGALLRLVVEGEGGEVEDVTLAEPEAGIVGVSGDLVLGVGIGAAGSALDLLERAGPAGAGGVVLRAGPARDPQVVATAQRLGMALVELQPHASWSHVVWLLRGVLDRAAAPGAPLLGDAGVHGELFALADAAAAIVDAPVTIEDAQSRVLAYSARQERTDPARVSTIVGRRVPEPVQAHFRARGVFRKMARSSEPFYVPEGPDGTLPRMVVPVRAGGEWLGSIWAVVTGPVPQARVHELTRAASVLALHLLRLRAQADMARRASTEQIRALLRGAVPGTDPGPWLPAGPWRVVALGAPEATTDVRRALDLWESIARRFGWQQPLLADLDGVVFALLTVPGRPGTAGSLAWLRGLIDAVHPHDPALRAALGRLVTDRGELPRSRREAAELVVLLGTDRFPGPVLGIEDAWYAVTTARANAAVRAEDGLLGGPLPALLAHDREHGTAYLATLAAWLDHAGEPKTTAAALHIHVNTLRYRMRRIAEVAPLDLRSPEIRLALQLQLAALASAQK